MRVAEEEGNSLNNHIDIQRPIGGVTSHPGSKTSRIQPPLMLFTLSLTLVVFVLPSHFLPGTLILDIFKEIDAIMEEVLLAYLQ